MQDRDLVPKDRESEWLAEQPPQGPSFWRTLGDGATEFVRHNFARLAFGLLGLVVAILFLTLGFWGTMLIVLCVGVGAYLGGPRDRHRKVIAFIGELIKGNNKFDA